MLEKQSLPLLDTLFSQTRDCTTFTLHDLTDFYVERVTVHSIKINDHSCFHNSWPNSKTKLKLKHIWEQGDPLVFRGPYQFTYSAYREDRLWIYIHPPTVPPLKEIRKEFEKRWIKTPGVKRECVYLWSNQCKCILIAGVNRALVSHRWYFMSGQDLSFHTLHFYICKLWVNVSICIFMRLNK